MRKGSALCCCVVFMAAALLFCQSGWSQERTARLLDTARNELRVAGLSEQENFRKTFLGWASVTIAAEQEPREPKAADFQIKTVRRVIVDKT